MLNDVSSEGIGGLGAFFFIFIFFFCFIFIIGGLFI